MSPYIIPPRRRPRPSPRLILAHLIVIAVLLCWSVLLVRCVLNLLTWIF